MRPPLLVFALFMLAGLPGRLRAQQLQVRSVSIGYRVFELEEVGGNPTTIGRLMKDPVAYQDYLKSIQYDGFFGGRAIQRVPTYYLNAELGKRQATAGFWKAHSIQVGLLLSGRLEKAGMGLSREEFWPSPTDEQDFEARISNYLFVQQQRFAGLNLGLNRRQRLFSDHLHLVAGLHAQGSVAVSHYYEQERWFRQFVVEDGKQVKLDTGTEQLPDIAGKHFFQWQAMIPLGLEVSVLRQRLALRAETTFGVVGSAFRPKDFASREAHGAGIWLVYWPK